MPSSRNPSQITTQPGQVPVDTVSATALAYTPSEGGDLQDSLTLSESRPILYKSGPYTSVGDSTRNITGNYWFGVAGDEWTDLVQIVDSNGDPVFAGDGYKDRILVASAAIGATPVNPGDGFQDGVVTLTFNTTIPAAVDYYVVVGIESSYEDAPTGVLTQTSVRNSPRGEVLLDNLYNSLASGLDERYRRDPVVPGSPDVDSPGSGAVINRDGQAVTFIPAPQDWTANPYNDPYLANIVGDLYGTVSQTALTREYSGDLHNVHVGMWRVTQSNADEESTPNRPLASYAALNLRNPGAATFDGFATYTYIPKDSAAVLNPSGAGADMVEVSGGLYFQNGSGYTGICLGYDLLLITRASGVVETYIIIGFDTTTRVGLKTLGGATPSFPVDEAVTISWVQPLFTAGGGMRKDTAFDPKWGPLTIIHPTPFSQGGLAYDVKMQPARFVGPSDITSLALLALSEQNRSSGAVEDILTFYSNGQVDGPMYATDLKTERERTERNVVNVSGTTTFQWLPSTHGSYVVFRFTAADSSLTIEPHASYTPEDGDFFEFEFEPTVDTIGCTVTWDTDFTRVAEELDVINYRSNVWQVVRGRYNSTLSKFVANFDGPDELTLRGKVSILQGNRHYFQPPYDTSESDASDELFVGQGDDSFYVAHRGGNNLYYSADGRAPWSHANTGGLTYVMNLRTVRAAAGDGFTVLLASSGPGTATNGWIHYSDDSGITWNDGPALPVVEYGLKKVVHKGSGSFWALTAGSSPTNAVYYGTTTVAWTAATITGGHYLWDLDSSSTRVVFVGDDGAGNGVIYTDATTPGLTLAQSCPSLPLRAVARSSNGRWIALGASATTCWISDDNGATWSSQSMSGISGTIEIRGVVALGDVLVCMYASSAWTGSEHVYGLAISGDGGRTWKNDAGILMSTSTTAYDDTAPAAEIVTIAPGKNNERAIFNFGDLNIASTDSPAVSSWMTERLGIN